MINNVMCILRDGYYVVCHLKEPSKINLCCLGS